MVLRLKRCTERLRIETKAKTSVLVWATVQHNIPCTKGVRIVPGGYEILTDLGHGCGNDNVRTVLYVERSGAITLRKREIIKNERCPGAARAFLRLP